MRLLRDVWPSGSLQYPERRQPQAVGQLHSYVIEDDEGNQSELSSVELNLILKGMAELPVEIRRALRWNTRAKQFVRRNTLVLDHDPDMGYRHKRRHETDEESDSHPTKLTVQKGVNNAFRKVAEAPEEERIMVPLMDVVPRVSFFPDVPALRSEDSAAVLAKGSLGAQTYKTKQAYDKKGVLAAEYGTWKDGKAFLQECVSTRKLGQYRSTSSTTNSRAQRLVEDMHDRMAANSAAILQHMEVHNFPLASRQLVSEALHDATKGVMGECDFLSLEIAFLTWSFVLKTGRGFGSLIENGNAGGSKSSSKSGGRGSQGSNASLSTSASETARYSFNPSKYPDHVLPSEMKDPRPCYACVNKLVPAGKLKLHENIPMHLWFDGMAALEAHRSSKDCLNPKRDGKKK